MNSLGKAGAVYTQTLGLSTDFHTGMYATGIPGTDFPRSMCYSVPMLIFLKKTNKQINKAKQSPVHTNKSTKIKPAFVINQLLS